MDNYPPGVTGSELEIAGPDWEREAEESVVCHNDDCDQSGEWQDVEGMAWAYRHDVYFDWKCPTCGNENQNIYDRDDYFNQD